MDKPEFLVELGPVATDEAFAIGMAKLLEREGRTIAAAELRRLHAERAAADGVINDLVAKVRELQEANEAFGRRQKWWNERMVALEQQRDALLQALKALVQNEGLEPYSYLDKGIGTATAAGQRWLNARAVIKAVEEGK